jgi:hypothetical protein
MGPLMKAIAKGRRNDALAWSLYLTFLDLPWTA